MKAVRFLGGSIAVYLVMAACSAATGPLNGAPIAKGDAGPDAPDAVADSRSFLDALTDPETEASADVPDAGTPAPPDVATEPCVVFASTYYAEHLYPGKTPVQLAPVHAIVALHDTQRAQLPGYTQFVTTVLVRDGAAAAICTGPGDTVTFVLQQ